MCINMYNVYNESFTRDVGCLSYVDQVKLFDFGLKHVVIVFMQDFCKCYSISFSIN